MTYFKELLISLWRLIIRPAAEEATKEVLDRVEEELKE